MEKGWGPRPEERCETEMLVVMPHHEDRLLPLRLESLRVFSSRVCIQLRVQAKSVEEVMAKIRKLLWPGIVAVLLTRASELFII